MDRADQLPCERSRELDVVGVASFRRGLVAQRRDAGPCRPRMSSEELIDDPRASESAPACTRCLAWRFLFFAGRGLRNCGRMRERSDRIPCSDTDCPRSRGESWPRRRAALSPAAPSRSINMPPVQKPHCVRAEAVEGIDQRIGFGSPASDSHVTTSLPCVETAQVEAREHGASVDDHRCRRSNRLWFPSFSG